MKIHPQGIAPIIIILITAVITGGIVGGAWYYQENKAEKANSNTSIINSNLTANANTSIINSNLTANANTNYTVVEDKQIDSVDIKVATIDKEVKETLSLSDNDGSKAIVLKNIGDSYVFTDIETQITLTNFDVDEGLANLEINYSDGDNSKWSANNPGATGWVPNPSTYQNDLGTDLLPYAKVLYRAHYYCDGSLYTKAQPVGAYEKIDLSSGYSNFICRNRETEQCETDGTADHYYDERCDYGIVAFTENDTKSAPNFSLTVTSVSSEGVAIELKSS